jgi:ribosome-binding protein aMBF1 (putative translation factor)
MKVTDLKEVGLPEGSRPRSLLWGSTRAIVPAGGHPRPAVAPLPTPSRSGPVGSRRAQPYKRPMAGEGQTLEDPLLAAVGKRIRNLREAKLISPKDFADTAGFRLQYLWRLESGQQNLNLKSISRIALALGEPMTALLEGIEADPSTIGARPYTRKAE